MVIFVFPIASPCYWLRSIFSANFLSIQKLKPENKTTVAAFKQFHALSAGCVNCSELSLVQLIVNEISDRLKVLLWFQLCETDKRKAM